MIKINYYNCITCLIGDVVSNENAVCFGRFLPPQFEVCRSACMHVKHGWGSRLCDKYIDT